MDHIGKDKDTFGPPATPYFLAFIVVSIALNTLLTFLTAWRLHTQHRFMAATRATGFAAPLVTWQTTVITLTVESAAAWVVAAALYLAMLLINAPFAGFFEYLFQLTAVCELLRLLYALLIARFCSNSALSSSSTEWH
jgi:hypothetical protein